MPRDDRAREQDERAVARANDMVTELRKDIDDVRWFFSTHAQHAPSEDKAKVADALDGLDEMARRMEPHYTIEASGTEQEMEGSIKATAGPLVIAMAGQLAQFLADVDANNYRSMEFTIGPDVECVPKYSFVCQRVDAGKRSPSQKCSEVTAAALAAAALLRGMLAADVPAEMTVLRAEIEAQIQALQHAAR